MALDNTCVEHDESEGFQMVCHGCSKELLLRGLEPLEEGQCPSCGATFVVPHQFGDYMLQDIIEEDEVISTYAAHDLKLQREVFVKVVDKDYIDLNSDFSKGLNIPLNKSIATVYSSEFAEEGMLLITENIDGKTLNQIIIDGDHMTEDNIVAIIEQTAKSLAFASANGVIHGNLTPSSIWVTVNGQVKVADFYLRTNLCNANSSPEKIARALDVRYASPSKLKHLVNDEKSDLYSLGIILYQLFTRILPFPSRYYHEAIQERQSISVQNPRILNENIPVDIAELIVSLLTQDGTYNSFSEVIAFFEGRGVAKKVTPVKKPTKGKMKKGSGRKQGLKPRAVSKPVRASSPGRANRQVEKLRRSVFIATFIAVMAIGFCSILFMSRYFPASGIGKASEQFLGATFDQIIGKPPGTSSKETKSK